MQTLSQIKEILDSLGARPKRSLGQNFLVDHNLVRKLVDACDVQEGDVVLEVGPGTGTMTEELLERGASVVACELDDALAKMLGERMPARLMALGLPADRFTLVHADCLESKHRLSPAVGSALGLRRFKLVANLPYGAATPLLSTLLVDHPRCELMGVTIQREVGDRLLAKPGTKDFGALGVLAQALTRVQRVAICPPGCFWPPPDVTSSMVLLTRLATPLTKDPARLSAACRVLFAQRRKQLGSVLGKRVDLAALGGAPGCEFFKPELRAEQLNVGQVVALSWALPDELLAAAASERPGRGE